MFGSNRRRQPARAAGAAAVAAAAAFGVFGSSAARAADASAPSAAQLQDQIRQLQAQVDQLKAQQAVAPSKSSVDATVASVLNDADHRSQDPLNLAVGDADFLGGYKNGKFLIQSADGNFVFHPWLQIQARNVTNWRANIDGNGNDDWNNGFELARAKVGFDGNVFGKDLTYLFLMTFGRNTGSPTLQDVWARYRFAQDWAVRVGQFKDPFAHEGLISSKKLMTADRSFLEVILGGDDNYVQGITAIYDNGGALRAEAGVTDGFARKNANFLDPGSGGSDANFGIAGRAEYKLMVSWGAYDDETALGTTEDLFVVGAAFDETQSGDTDMFHHTIDAQYESPTGLGLYASYIGLFTGNNQAVAGATNDTYDWGVQLQASYLLNDKLEGFARYDYTQFDSKSVAAGTERHIHELTGGVNYYFHGHDAKGTLELDYLPNGTPIGDGNDVLVNNGDGELLIRAQFQLLI